MAHNWVNNGSSPPPSPFHTAPPLASYYCCCLLLFAVCGCPFTSQVAAHNTKRNSLTKTIYLAVELVTDAPRLQLQHHSPPYPPFHDYPLSIPLPDLTASANGFWLGVGHGFPCQLQFVVVVVFLLVLFTHFKQPDFIFHLPLSLSVCLPVHLAGFLFNVCFQFYLSVSVFQLQKAFDILFHIPFSFTLQIPL